MAKKKTSPFQRQASYLTLVRYGPEISALTALLRDAQSSRDTRLTQATNARQAGVRAAYDAGPRVAQAYQGAGEAVSPAFVGGGGIEASALTARLGESEALARTQLEDRRVSAIQGEGSARQQILRDFRQDKGKIQARALDLAHESGAYGASTLQQLIGDDAAAKAKAKQDALDRQTSLDKSLISAGIDPATNAPIPNGPLDPNSPRYRDKTKPKGPSKPSATDRSAASLYGKASAWIRSLDNAAYAKKFPDPVGRRHGIAELLLKGDKNSGIPAIPQPLLAAALDMRFLHYVHPHTVQLLHDQGYKVRALPNAVTNANLTPQQRARIRAQNKPDWLQTLFHALTG